MGNGIRVQSQEHRHPGLHQLVVALLHQAARQGIDEVHQLVVVRVRAGAGLQRPDLQVSRSWRERFEMLDERRDYKQN